MHAQKGTARTVSGVELHPLLLEFTITMYKITDKIGKFLGSFSAGSILNRKPAAYLNDAVPIVGRNSKKRDAE